MLNLQITWIHHNVNPLTLVIHLADGKEMEFCQISAAGLILLFKVISIVVLLWFVMYCQLVLTIWPFLSLPGLQQISPAQQHYVQPARFAIPY